MQFCGVGALDGCFPVEEVADVGCDVLFPGCCAAVCLWEGVVVGGDVETEGGGVGGGFQVERGEGCDEAVEV